MVLYDGARLSMRPVLDCVFVMQIGTNIETLVLQDLLSWPMDERQRLHGNQVLWMRAE